MKIINEYILRKNFYYGDDFSDEPIYIKSGLMDKDFNKVKDSEVNKLIKKFKNKEMNNKLTELAIKIEGNGLTFDEYQEKAITTKIYPEGLAIPYVTLGLMGEAGEIAEKIKKIIRDKNSLINDEDKILLKKEIGDVLWYCAALADELGLKISDIAQVNIDKLEKRKLEGKLGGSGDNR